MLSFAGNRILVCFAPCAHGALCRDVFPRLLGARSNGEILQQSGTFEPPSESAHHGNNVHV